MTIGPRIGLVPGLRGGLGIGVGVDEIASGSSVVVSRDGSSNIYVPASLTEWNALLAPTALGSPSLLWLCQEASGSLADSIGTATGTATGTGTTYAQAVSGWTRVGVAQSSGTSKIQTISATLPDISTTSCLAMTYILPTSADSNRTIHQLGAVNGVSAARSNMQLTGFHQLVSVGVSAAGTTDMRGVVTPLVLAINRTASTNKSYSKYEKLSQTFQAALSGQLFGIGMGNSIVGTTIYVAVWFGAAAEMSDAGVKTLLTTLGWAIPWS